MKLATLDNGARDGRLVVVSHDLTRCIERPDIAPTLQAALDDWDAAAPRLRQCAQALNCGEAPGACAFDPARALAPLPRAYQWLDASAFLNHGRLMTKSLNLAIDPQADPLPLMYQGASDDFLPPAAPALFMRAEDGIDFEGEFAVIVRETPMGVSAAEAERFIVLVMLVNDWSLRALAPREMKTGFGFLQAKPSTSFAPVAVIPDALGGGWREGRVHLPLKVEWNGEIFGRPHGGAMSYSFGELIAHAASTRRLRAGAIIGSGTVSNENAEVVGSACIAERRALDMIAGRAPTAFMAFGDTVRISAADSDGRSVFGDIAQTVVQARE